MINNGSISLQGSAGISEVYHSKWNSEASKGKFFRFELDPNCQTLYDVFRRGLKISSELLLLLIMMMLVVYLLLLLLTSSSMLLLLMIMYNVAVDVVVYVVIVGETV